MPGRRAPAVPLPPFRGGTRTGWTAVKAGARSRTTFRCDPTIGRPLALPGRGSGDRCGGVLLDDASVEQVDAALGVPRVAGVVRHHAQRGAAPVELLEQLHHRLAA